MVIDYPHLDPRTRPLFERGKHTGAYVVVNNNVILQVDVVLRGGDVGQQGVELDGAVVEHLRVVPFVIVRPAQSRSQIYTCLKRLRGTPVAKIREMTRSETAELAAIAPRDDSLGLDVASEHQIQHQSHQRHHKQHGDPRERFDRIAVLAHHHGHHSANGHAVQQIHNPPYPAVGNIFG